MFNNDILELLFKRLYNINDIFKKTFMRVFIRVQIHAEEHTLCIYTVSGMITKFLQCFS